jgi:hypothetical protein
MQAFSQVLASLMMLNYDFDIVIHAEHKDMEPNAIIKIFMSSHEFNHNCVWQHMKE